MSHELTVTNSTTGESSCPCGWTYYVRNFRPMWPMSSIAVQEQVHDAYAAHVRIADRLERQQELSRAPGSWRCRCGAENPNAATLCRKCNRGTIDEVARVKVEEAEEILV